MVLLCVRCACPSGCVEVIVAFIAVFVPDVVLLCVGVVVAFGFMMASLLFSLLLRDGAACRC